ncbi:hypothetical protein JYU34_017137 [Plutella xylostella]|uniref:Uncharacterized protein n=1 Tax=Plutella xylostella TaxID=51655 RepID=A0ABQ7Q0P5_PLUXY|nr:hypothetical protein JYU34_017137 [Plutella xylostella]
MYFCVEHHSTIRIPRNIINMIAKFVALVCLFGLAAAGNLYGSGLGYAGYGGYYGGYAAPVVAKSYVAPVSYAPAVSHVSQYSYSAPVVKTYAAPLVKSYAAPVVSSYAYSPYSAYAATPYSYGGYGAYGKYVW